MEVEANYVDSQDAAELGFFFTTAAVLRFSSAPADAPRAPGSAQAVAVADRYGVLAFSDQNGALGGGWRIAGGDQRSGAEVCRARAKSHLAPALARALPQGVYVARIEDLLAAGSTDHKE